jgi:hypothetical protein
LTPKSSEAFAARTIVLPRAAVAGALSVIAGAASETGCGAWMFGYWPEVGSDCGPERNGRKSTALEVVPSSVTTGVPFTGFSGTGGLTAGEIAGPLLTGGGVNRTPQ